MTLKQRAEQLLDLFHRRKWTVIVVCLLAVGAAAVYTYLQTPLYRTTSLVYVHTQPEAGGGETETDVTARSAGGSSSLFERGGRSLESELTILRNSRSLRMAVARRIVERGRANELLDPQVRTATLFFEPTSPSTSSNPRPPTVASALSGHVKFDRADRRADVIRITASHPNPDLATLIANVYLDEYLQLTREASRAQLSASEAFLEKQAQSRRQELQAIEQEIQEFKTEEGAYDLTKRESRLVDQIAEVEATLDDAQVELQTSRASLRSMRAKLDSIRPDELSERLGSGIEEEIEALKKKIADLELSKQQVLLRAGPMTSADSTQVEQIEGRIDELRNRVSRLSDRYVSDAMSSGLSVSSGVERIRELRSRIEEKEIEISSIEARIEVLNNRLDTYEEQLNELPEMSRQLAQLERRRQRAEQAYESVMEQLRKARVRTQSELGYAEKVSEASQPSQPVRPRPMRNAMAGLLLGLFGGGALALVRDRLDSRVYKPDTISEMGYREIGVIPNLNPIIEDQLEGAERIERRGTEVETSLISEVNPNSAAAEAYRRLRTNIQLSSSDDEEVETLMVTSPGSGDGKSITAANLAIVTAQAGYSTLLVDTDLRRPRIHKLFGLPHEPGLTDALAKREPVQSRTVKPLMDELAVLPVGTNTDNPSEVLSSPRFREFLEEAREVYDFVVLDTPPVLAASDAPLLSRQSDATLCVVRAGMTTEAELDHAMRDLGDVGARIIGAVFNGFDMSMAYGYKLRYRHYSQYGPYDQYRSLPSGSSADEDQESEEEAPDFVVAGKEEPT